MTDILCLGEAMVEFVRQPDGTYLRGFGGDTSNAAIAAARQGASVGYLTALGSDPFGNALMDLWAREQVDTSHVIRSDGAQTGIYFVDPDPAGQFFTYYREGSAASRMEPHDISADAIRTSRILHLSGITLAISDPMRRTVEAAVEIATQAGTAISLDTNLRLKLWSVEDARAYTHNIMRSAKIACTSIDDSINLTGLRDPRDIAAFYHDIGPEIVLVTLGSEGAMLSVSGDASPVPAAKAEPIDSTGAGDSFVGSFLAHWLETGDAHAATRYATHVAAGTVSGFGAVDPIPRRAEVLSRMGS